jgi:hypothetical protein
MVIASVDESAVFIRFCSTKIGGLGEHATDSGNGLAGEISRQHPDRIVKAFNEGYLVVGSDETNDAVCVMTAIGMPGDGAKYGIQIEAPPAS